MPEIDWDNLSWLERLVRVTDETIADGTAPFGATMILAALIRGLHAKGVLSDHERDTLFAQWDRLDAYHREHAEAELAKIQNTAYPKSPQGT